MDGTAETGAKHMPNLYALRTLAPGHYAMAKFDEDFNVEAVYNVITKGSGYSCDCPAGQRSVKLKPCKHQRMMPLMLGACNLQRFYDPERGAWVEPLAPELAEQIAAEANGHDLEPASPQAPTAEDATTTPPPPPSSPSMPTVRRRI